jgi:hypothetical protein
VGAVVCELPEKIAIGSGGRTKVTAGWSGRLAMPSRSDLVNVSVAKLTIVRSGTPSSGGEIDAVTLLAHNPQMTARKTAASQIVLIISTPNELQRTRSINLNFAFHTIADSASARCDCDRG